jgi:histidinol phosphatase-like PHP family hydrolase
MMVLSPVFGNVPAPESYDFPLADLHVHLTNTFTIEKALELAENRKVKLGIVEHPAPWALKDDADLKKYIDKLRKYPVLIGLQPWELNWAANYSPELLKQIDYVLMDAQNIPLGNGEFQRIYEWTTYVDDVDGFMERYMNYSLNILHNEPINIFGWTLFLPVCIARDYYTIWTEKRMQELITAAKARNIAFEINDMSHTPHDKFIKMAKAQGLKFTFGTDARNSNACRLDYCKAVAKKCGLQESDFYKPVKKA